MGGAPYQQYRCPEVIIGSKYDTSADMWSFACIIFEMLTGDLLFDPRAGEGYEREAVVGGLCAVLAIGPMFWIAMEIKTRENEELSELLRNAMRTESSLRCCERPVRTTWRSASS